MQKIGIFGGTYNPPHVGHLNIVNEFIRKYELSKVLIIPTYTPPHKESSYLASATDRIEMCKRTFSDEVFEISDIEIQRRGKSYTCDTLRELTEDYPDAKFYFLVGDDMLLTFHEWRNPEDILDLCTVVAAVRSDDLTETVLLDYIMEKYPDEYNKGAFELLHMEPLPLSSTVIRNSITEGKSIDGLVTSDTKKYIEDRGLYHA